MHARLPDTHPSYLSGGESDDHQIFHKLATVLFAVLVNGVALGSVSYLFAPPAVALPQPQNGPSAGTDARGAA